MSGDALELAPFRGLRYATADARSLMDSPTLNLGLALAPPYDVLDAAAVSGLMRAEPRNAVRLTVPPAASATNGATRALAGPDRYARAAETFQRWIDDGVLVRDTEPLLYVYEQTAPDGGRQRGLVGALRLPRPGSTVVRPHEEVLSEPVADRARLMAAARANLEPIFLLYRGGTGARRGTATRTVDAVAESAAAPLVDTTTGDRVTHRLWAVADPRVQADITADLAARTALIADGHHRYAAYQRLRAERTGPGAWDHGLALLVDSDATPPRVGAIHRVLPGLEAGRAARAARALAEIDTIPADGAGELRAALDHLAKAAADGPALLLVGGGTGYLLHGFAPERLAAAMPDRSPVWRALPTAVLTRVLLPLWDRTDEAARLVHDDPAGAVAALRPDLDSAVLLPALSVDDVYAVTAAGELTPRKSTSFGPKPRTGLVMRTLQ
ncbi:DUF1015 family protein [Marinitenerispora sediminis]|uniref:DUF1015 domain-containing protein n=1 Tax=Marinitenerispora sediminis TaxID=1931232 RepID=A0A368T6S2_9ACTN|nr:DUF1015 domain-containing protein [Marinitenerispora sediminis]RCV59524.1 DUF1015 domain-containing protein [Marinitenerispora sediminis]RCV59784.1 DUF1015 domain-containing protein [Marinitenerispora sediminis]